MAATTVTRYSATTLRTSPLSPRTQYLLRNFPGPCLDPVPGVLGGGRCVSVLTLP